MHPLIPVAIAPTFAKSSPRDSFKVEEKMAGYRFGKNLFEKWPDEIAKLNYVITLL